MMDACIYSATGHMKNCLVIDDSRVVRKVAARILTDLGLQCVEAEDGQRALDSCRKLMPDLIVLDWNMPVMSGIEFLEHLRKMEGGKTPKVIFCTTESDIKQLNRAIAAGANEYIMKPFDGDMLREKIRLLGFKG